MIGFVLFVVFWVCVLWALSRVARFGSGRRSAAGKDWLRHGGNFKRPPSGML